LYDREAFAWQGDFYHDMVKANLGDNTDDNFRIWYTDKALHGDLSKQEFPTRTVSYLGVLQQALRDLSAWCEKGVTPPNSTNYKIKEGQVIVPAKAAERKGIQPIVNLTVKGSKKAEVKIGTTITFTAEIDVPQHTGKVVSAEWDFEGKGMFPISEKTIIFDAKRSKSKISRTYTFRKSGTYFTTLKIASQRDGDIKTPFARIQNLDRVRVVVK
jgi:plastocyanin